MYIHDKFLRWFIYLRWKTYNVYVRYEHCFVFTFAGVDVAFRKALVIFVQFVLALFWITMWNSQHLFTFPWASLYKRYTSCTSKTRDQEPLEHTPSKTNMCMYTRFPYQYFVVFRVLSFHFIHWEINKTNTARTLQSRRQHVHVLQFIHIHEKWQSKLNHQCSYLYTILI